MKTTVKSYHYESVDSTMSVAKILAACGEVSEPLTISEVDMNCSQLSDLVVITADEQISGRGRFQRRWYSENGAGLYVTYQFSIPVGFSKLDGFSLAVGVAVKRAISKFAVQIKLKWPNDVVVFNEQNELCKLAGILIELVSAGDDGDDNEKLYVNAGVGINLKQTSYPEKLMHKAISLEELSASRGNGILKESLLQELSAEFWKVCDEYFMNGFSAGLKAEWEENNACAGMKIKVSPAAASDVLQERSGTMVGVDNDGSLLLRDEQAGETARISIGDVSLYVLY